MTPKVWTMVKVVDAIDREIHDVSKFIGRIGEGLRIGARDGDPSFADALLVGFCDGSTELFWPEELGTP